MFTRVSNSLCLLLLIVAAATSLAHGADIVLRTHAEVSGPVLRLGDIADVHAKNPSQLHSLITTPLGPAPQTRQFLRTAEVRDLLFGRGVDLRSVRFSGAAVVEVGKTPTTSKKVTEPKLTDAQRETLADEVQRAVVAYLQKQSSHDLWEVELLRSRVSLNEFYAPGQKLTVSGGKSPWTGRQSFVVYRPGDTEGVAVAARVRRSEMIAYAVRPIEVGHLIRAADVELRPFVGSAPTQAYRSSESVVGTEARRAIRADEMISSNFVRAPILVSRGETVSVYARTGGITVRTFATAKQDGSLGDLIQVESSDGRERYAARVSNRRELEVFATGASANDFARGR